MAYEHKPGFGGIFKNHKKEKENHPDYTGQFKGLDGKLYNAALWVKEDKNGKNYFSFSMSEVRETKSNPPF